MSGRGVESVEARKRNRSGRCMFPEMKRGKRTTEEGKTESMEKSSMKSGGKEGT